MSTDRLVGSTPLDDFLTGADSSTETGELLQKLGLLGSLLGLTLAVGLIIFLAVVHTGRRSEIRLLLKVVGAAGLLTLVGAAVEIAGFASILDIGWSDAVTDTSAAAAMMRLLAGLLITLGFFDHIVPAGDPEQSSGVDVHAELGPTEQEPELNESRWIPSAASAFGIGGALAGVLSFGFDGHTVTEGPRVVHALVNVVHVTAGSVWFGGVVALTILSIVRGRVADSVAPMMLRFSSVATVALIAVTLAGALMTLMIIDGFGDFTSTDWGRILIIKTVAVALVVVVGAYNHFVIVPGLGQDPDDVSMIRRARTTVTIEAIVLLFVAVATVFLTVASTN